MTSRRSGGGLAGAVGATLSDAGQALRSLLRSRAFTLFAAGILALGLGTATAVYTAMERVVFNPLPYPDAERMAVLWRTTDGDVVFAPEVRHLPVWSALDIFEGMEAYQARGPTLTGRGAPRVLRMKSVTPGYFRLLGLDPILGRGFLPDEHRGAGRRSVVLSHEFWTDAFGRDPGVLGSTLTLDAEPWTVVGVLPRGAYPPNSGPGLTDLWAPLGDAAEGTVWPVTRLRPGITIEQADERLAVLAEGAPEAGLGPAAEWRGKAFDAASFGRGRVADRLRILFAGVLLLLLVAAMNVSNLFLRRSASRDREQAVRTALGAGRARLVRQIVFEGLGVAALGGAAGLGLASWLVELIEAARPEATAWLLDGLAIEGRVLIFGVGASVGAGLLASLLPALRLVGRRRTLTTVLRGPRAADGPGRKAVARWALVSAEVALSFALVTAALAAAGALTELTSRDPGFGVEGLVQVRVELPQWRHREEADRRAVFLDIEADVARSPAVADVGVAEGVPPGLPGVLARLQVAGGEPAEQTSYVRTAEVPPGFLGLMQQPLVAGRDLVPEDATDGTNPVVVGRSTVRRLLPALETAEAAVGRRFTLGEGEEPLTIVGVAADVLVDGLARNAAVPLVYRPRTSWTRTQVLAVRLEAGTDPERWAAGARVRERVLSLAPEAVVDVVPVPTALSRTVAEERFTALLLTCFAVLALVLAGVGMYGVLSQIVGGRTREIGIRVSLGADDRAVRSLVLRGGAAAISAGLVAGILLAWSGLDRLLGSSFPSGVPPRVFLLAAVVLSAVALAALWHPARRAARVDPAVAMRTD